MPGIAPLPSLQDFADEVLALYEAPQRAAPTRDKMRQVLSRLMRLPSVATVADLTPATVSLLVRDRMAEGVSEVTIDTDLRVLRAACGIAMRSGYLTANPVGARRRWLPYGYEGRPAVASPETRGSLTDDRLKRLMVRLLDGSVTWEGHRLFALVALVLYAGPRRNEALEAAKADFDLAAGSLHVPKGSAWKRDRRLPPPLVAILGEWLPRVGKDCPHAFPGTLRAGPWTGGRPGTKAIDGVRGAGLAVGIGGLTFERLRAAWEARGGRVALPSFERLRPPPRTYSGPRPGRPGPKPTIVLDLSRGRSMPALVRGSPLPRLLTHREFNILQTMVDEGCLGGARLTERRLDEESGHPSSVRTLRELRRLEPLDTVLIFPGGNGAGGYGLASR